MIFIQRVFTKSFSLFFVLLIFTLSIFCCACLAYAGCWGTSSPVYTTVSASNGSVTYGSQFGWGDGGGDTKPESWMWVWPSSRGVQAGAVQSQAGLTIVGDGYKSVEWGPRNSNSGYLPQNTFIESHCNNVYQVSHSVSYAWGYGIVRDPGLGLHDINTPEKAVISRA